jgi:hypothetical protein
LGESGWQKDGVDLEGNRSVVAYDTMTGELGDALGWTIYVEQDRTEINQAVSEITLRGGMIAPITYRNPSLWRLGVSRHSPRAISTPLIKEIRTAIY